ncbi:hypothetical protein KAU33_09760 [Candidatus Dependentiae bacterium]|nr:hypothetical protein [Candidatus Dependentiae bacterium]
MKTKLISLMILLCIFFTYGINAESESLDISAIVEAEYKYSNEDENMHNSTTAAGEIMLTSPLIDNVNVKLVVNIEEEETGEGSETLVELDEAYIFIKNVFGCNELAMKIGKLDVPFGEYEGFLSTETWTEETPSESLLGLIRGNMLILEYNFENFSISSTVYDRDNEEEPNGKENGFSIKLNLSILEDLNLGTAYRVKDNKDNELFENNNEDWIISVFGELGNLEYSFEFMKAVSRVLVEPLPSTYFGALQYEISDTIAIAARYEIFNDNVEGIQEEQEEYKYLFGAEFTLRENLLLILEHSSMNFEAPEEKIIRNNMIIIEYEF